MKTTIDIADPLLEQARKLAARDGTTVKALVEQGLKRVIAERRKPGEFRLRDASFGRDGLQEGLEDLSWERIGSLVYEERGG
jgi:hypothetical protein